MAYTTDQIVTRLSARFRDPNNHIVSQALWVDHLQDAERWFMLQSGGNEWPWMEKRGTVTVLANTNAVAMPADFYKALTVWNETDEINMGMLQGATSWRIRWAPDSTGAPLEYRFYGNQLEVFPTPTQNTDIIVDYIAGMTLIDPDLTNEPTDTGDVDPTDVGIPDTIAPALIEYALFLAYTDDDNSEAATQHMTLADMQVEQIKAKLLSGQGAAYPQIVDSWFRRGGSGG